MTDGIAVGLVLSILLNFIGNIVSVQSLETCPSFCTCDTWYMLHRVSCSGRHLYNIDTGAPSNVQALDLSDNVISFLNNFELANAGLTNLKYLNLSRNTINEIGLNAFHNLADLAVVDLSKNYLHYILSDVFMQNKNLRVLKLSRNNFNSNLPKLRSPSLTELSLDSCLISHLPPDTFDGLTHIQRLDLSNNLMIQMDSAVVQRLHFLKKLSIEGNPWSCNNVMHDLQIYLKYKDVKFGDVCTKNTNPKKFEKMILLPTKKQDIYHHWTITTGQETELVTNANYSNPLNNKNTTYKQTACQMNNIDLFWFLLLGFIFGTACGMVVSYICLSGKYICSRHWRRNHNDASQRLSLLLNSYLQDSVESSTSLATSCPGTPPPSYREVVLRPSLYRYLSRHSNLNNNNTGYRERYT
ncbi:leucine-rich repeat transmembrane protein FLRT3 isoform X1 [Colletes latitarsis]|uniref:leucine-rich repeat transmembrane protein FLRT3 isoform X1 n=1 Tax=Colletes latitarsis TaxID=2605962 RepID=UPI004035B7D3